MLGWHLGPPCQPWVKKSCQWTFFQRCKKWQTWQIYLCYLFQMVLIFKKAMRKTMQTPMPAAPVLHCSSAYNASAISNSVVSTGAISTSAISTNTINDSIAVKSVYWFCWYQTVGARSTSTSSNSAISTIAFHFMPSGLSCIWKDPTFPPLLFI